MPALYGAGLMDRGAAGVQDLDDHRQQRHTDDAQRDEGEVVFDDGHVSKEIPHTEAKTYPGDRAGDVIERERRIRHLRDASHEGDERAHDGHEAAEHDRLAAAPLEELVRASDVGGG